MAADDAVLAVHRHTGEVAHVLVGTGQLVEQGGLAAVLVAYQGKGQRRAVRQGIAAALGMETAFLTQSGVFLGPGQRLFSFGGFRICRGDPDLFRFCQAESQFISVDPQLHGIAHGRQLDHGHFRAGDHAHIQEMLPQGAFSADFFNDGGPAGFQFVEFHIFIILPRKEIQHVGFFHGQCTTNRS